MFNVSGGQNNDTPIYELEETGDERFEITLPLPGNQYFYDYTVEYSDGSKVTIQDPVNPSKRNSAPLSFSEKGSCLSRTSITSSPVI